MDNRYNNLEQFNAEADADANVSDEIGDKSYDNSLNQQFEESKEPNVFKDQFQKQPKINVNDTDGHTL